MADGMQVWHDTQAAALANVMGAVDNPAAGPNFRPGTAQMAGAHYSGSNTEASVVSPDAQAALDQMARLKASAQDRINGPVGPMSDGVIDSGYDAERT